MSLNMSIFRSPEEAPFEVKLQNVRPHSTEILPLAELECGERVLMNFNAEYPQERGYWYDVLVKRIKTSRKGRVVIGDVTVGINNAVLNNRNLIFLDDIYKIKPYQLISERTPQDDAIMQTQPSVISNNK